MSRFWFRNIFILFFALFHFIRGQFEPRYDPFDWIIFTKPGAITSISEGYSYIYFGTEMGGVLRYHIYANKMDFPLTMAQGLSSNRIQSVHFDFESGVLWVATDKGLDYSHMREGGWTHLKKRDIGMGMNNPVKKVGSSQRYLWIQSNNSFLKLDQNSGNFLSVMSHPDDEKINWSASSSIENIKLEHPIDSYIMMEGWIYNSGILIDPSGRSKSISTFYSSRYGDVWMGINDGTIFKGDYHMETFYPITYGLAETNVSALNLSESGTWIAGNSNPSLGITYLNPEQNYYHLYEYEVNINMPPQKIYSLLSLKDEIWFGGELGILIYNTNRDYWRILDESKINLKGSITTMAWDSSFVWIGSNYGISRVNPVSKRAEIVGSVEGVSFESFFKNESIYDIEYIEKKIWIGTEYGLFIYDDMSESIYDFRKFGNFSILGGEENQFSEFWEIEKYKNVVYFATKQGIISYNTLTGYWNMLFRSHSIRQQRVTSMAFNDRYGFFGTNFSLLKFDFKHLFIDEYSYPIIGQINELSLEDDQLWIGSSQGLIRYLWKNE